MTIIREYPSVRILLHDFRTGQPLVLYPGDTPAVAEADIRP